MSRRNKVAAVSILAPSTGSPTKRAAPRSERHISARRWMQRTTKPSGVPESPANSEKGYGKSRVKTKCARSCMASPNQPPAKPGTYHTPSPLIHNLYQPKIQLSHKLLHCLVQATGHLNLANPLGHSFDSFYPLQRRKEGLRPPASGPGRPLLRRRSDTLWEAFTRTEKRVEGSGWQCIIQDRGDGPYLFEGTWELVAGVPGALAHQAREQSCDFLWSQSAQCIVKHEFSEEQLMAAHGTGHSACQLHCASLIHIAQSPEHLHRRGRFGEPAVSLSFPNLTHPSCPLTSTRWWYSGSSNSDWSDRRKRSLSISF